MYALEIYVFNHTKISSTQAIQLIIGFISSKIVIFRIFELFLSEKRKIHIHSFFYFYLRLVFIVSEPNYNNTLIIFLSVI